MASLLREHIARSDDARALLRQIFRTDADPTPDLAVKTLTVGLHHLTHAAHDQAIEKLCAELNATHRRSFQAPISLWSSNSGHLDFTQIRRSEVRVLAAAMFQHCDRLFTFIEYPGVEPANNAAERALRHAVIWRKIPFGNQSAKGEIATARLLTRRPNLRHAAPQRAGVPLRLRAAAPDRSARRRQKLKHHAPCW